MFKHRFLFLLGLVMVSGLSSCGNLYSSSSSASSRGPTPGYYKEELKYSLADNPKWGVFGAINDMGHVPVGTPDVLILPVVFNDIDKEFDQTKMDFIHEAYTGENLEDNAFYSLKEFYSVSSYGKLDIDVHFADPFRTSMTTSEFETLFKLSPPAGVTLETDPIITIIDEYLDTISEAELAELDNDNNGYIDSVHLIYLTKDNADTNIWWHFTYGDFYKASKQRSKRPGIYFFSNYETGMHNGRYEGYPDSHTIIHEYGHTLGLADYYSYDDTMAMYAGAVDMMDLNIGDHTAYSKMMGWIDPYVVDGTKENFEITIKPFEESGDCIVMGNPSKDPFNDTVFDEYIILSYYTPTGINGRDAGGYAEWTGHGFNKLGGTYQNSGLQAFHVDSRTVYYNFTGYEFFETYQDILDHGDYYAGMAASNTPSRSFRLEDGQPVIGEGELLYTAICADGVQRFGPGMGSVDKFNDPDILFEVGDKYSESTGPKNLNDGNPVSYDFEVVSMDEEGITLSFSAV